MINLDYIGGYHEQPKETLKLLNSLKSNKFHYIGTKSGIIDISNNINIENFMKSIKDNCDTDAGIKQETPMSAHEIVLKIIYYYNPLFYQNKIFNQHKNYAIVNNENKYILSNIVNDSDVHIFVIDKLFNLQDNKQNISINTFNNLYNDDLNFNLLQNHQLYETDDMDNNLPTKYEDIKLSDIIKIKLIESAILNNEFLDKFRYMYSYNTYKDIETLINKYFNHLNSLTINDNPVKTMMNTDTIHLLLKLLHKPNDINREILKLLEPITDKDNSEIKLQQLLFNGFQNNESDNHLINLNKLTTYIADYFTQNNSEFESIAKFNSMNELNKYMIRLDKFSISIYAKHYVNFLIKNFDDEIKICKSQISKLESEKTSFIREYSATINNANITKYKDNLNSFFKNMGSLISKMKSNKITTDELNLVVFANYVNNILKVMNDTLDYTQLESLISYIDRINISIKKSKTEIIDILKEYLQIPKLSEDDIETNIDVIKTNISSLNNKLSKDNPQIITPETTHKTTEEIEKLNHTFKMLNYVKNIIIELDKDIITNIENIHNTYSCFDFKESNILNVENIMVKKKLIGFCDNINQNIIDNIISNIEKNIKESPFNTTDIIKEEISKINLFKKTNDEWVFGSLYASKIDNGTGDANEFNDKINNINNIINKPLDNYKREFIIEITKLLINIYKTDHYIYKKKKDFNTNLGIGFGTLITYIYIYRLFKTDLYSNKRNIFMNLINIDRVIKVDYKAITNTIKTPHNPFDEQNNIVTILKEINTKKFFTYNLKKYVEDMHVLCAKTDLDDIELYQRNDSSDDSSDDSSYKPRLDRYDIDIYEFTHEIFDISYNFLKFEKTTEVSQNILKNRYSVLKFLVNKYCIIPDGVYVPADYYKIYKNGTRIPDCVETTILNFINILIFKNNMLNIDSLPASTMTEIINFYKKFNTINKQDNINAHEELLYLFNDHIRPILQQKYATKEPPIFADYIWHDRTLYNNKQFGDIKSNFINITQILTLIFFGKDALNDVNIVHGKIGFANKQTQQWVTLQFKKINDLFPENTITIHEINTQKDKKLAYTHIVINNTHSLIMYIGHATVELLNVNKKITPELFNNYIIKIPNMLNYTTFNSLYLDKSDDDDVYRFKNIITKILRLEYSNYNIQQILNLILSTDIQSMISFDEDNEDYKVEDKVNYIIKKVKTKLLFTKNFLNIMAYSKFLLSDIVKLISTYIFNNYLPYIYYNLEYNAYDMIHPHKHKLKNLKILQQVLTIIDNIFYILGMEKIFMEYICNQYITYNEDPLMNSSYKISLLTSFKKCLNMFLTGDFKITSDIFTFSKDNQNTNISILLFIRHYYSSIKDDTNFKNFLTKIIDINKNNIEAIIQNFQYFEYIEQKKIIELLIECIHAYNFENMYNFDIRLLFAKLYFNITKIGIDKLNIIYSNFGIVDKYIYGTDLSVIDMHKQYKYNNDKYIDKYNETDIIEKEYNLKIINSIHNKNILFFSNDKNEVLNYIKFSYIIEPVRYKHISLEKKCNMFNKNFRLFDTENDFYPIKFFINKIYTTKFEVNLDEFTNNNETVKLSEREENEWEHNMTNNALYGSSDKIKALYDYIIKTYLNKTTETIPLNGGYYFKYLKYKQKYLKLKKIKYNFFGSDITKRVSNNIHNTWP